MTTRVRHLTAAAIYAALAVIFTFPLVLHLSSQYPSPGAWSGGDPDIFIWYFDWISKMLTHRLPVPAGQMLFYPNGINPLAGYDGPLMLLLGVPLTLLTGNPVLAYNVFILAALVSSAFAAYLLGLRLLRSWQAALLVGFLYGLSPYMLVRALQHPNLLMIGTLPLLVLAMLKVSDEPRKKLPYLWLGLAALANAASSWYYAITGLVFIALIVLCTHKVWRKNIAQFFLAGIVIAVATVALALPMLLNRPHTNTPYDKGFVDRMGAKPIDFILPSAFNNVFGGLRQYIHDDPPYSRDLPVPNVFERSTYFGLPLLLMVAVFIKRRKDTRLPLPWLWISGFVVFSVMAMGSVVVLFGHTIPLPFAIIRQLFPFSLARVPNRFFVGGLLCAAIMAGELLSRVTDRKWPSGFREEAIAAVVLTLLLAERIILPFPLFSMHDSKFYTQLAQDHDTYAIADLPNVFPDYSDYNSSQVIHGKPTTGGAYFYPAYSKKAFSELYSNPLLAIGICDPRQNIGAVDLNKDVWPDLRAKNVRYVVVHNLIVHNVPECVGVQQRIREVLTGIKPEFTDGELTVYRVPAE